MRWLNLIPILSLVGLAVVMVVGMRAEPDPLLLQGMPEHKDLRRPEIHTGSSQIRGRIIDAAGTPVADASLFVAQNGRPLWTVSDAAGAFLLEDVNPGPVVVAINHRDHAPVRIETLAGPQSVELDLGERLPDPPSIPVLPVLDLEGTASVRGTEDLTGYEVALLPTASANRREGGLPRRVLLDADGSFRVQNLLQAEYEVLLLPPWAQGGSWPDLLAGQNHRHLRYTHPPAEQGAPTALDLVAQAGEVSGFAHDRDDGRLLQGAMIVALPVRSDGESPDQRRFPAVQSDATGAFRLRHLPPGRYLVRLAAGADRREVEVVVPAQGAVDPGF